jgi:hypothetical protein
LLAAPVNARDVRRLVIANEIRTDVGALLDSLVAAGFRINGHYDPATFGNWYVDVTGPRRFRLIKDRGQFMIEGPEKSLRQADLWRAFNTPEEFETAVLRWAVA